MLRVYFKPITWYVEMHHVSVWRHGFFILPDVHSQRVYLQEESLPCFLSAIELSAWPLFITIVNRGDWLGSPANIKGANKDAKIIVGRSATLHNLLFCPHTLCMNYITNTFLLVSSSISGKQLLCFVQGRGQKREQKHKQRTLTSFITIPLY